MGRIDPPVSPPLDLRTRDIHLQSFETDIGGSVVRGCYHDTGQGQWAVMMHGFHAGPYMYGNQLRALVQRGYSVVAPYLAGFGRSDGIDDLSMEGYALWAHDFIKTLDSKVHLVGHSFGGGISAAFAARFPELVASLHLEMSIGGMARNKVPFRDMASAYAQMLFPAHAAFAAVKSDGWRAPGRAVATSSSVRIDWMYNMAKNPVDIAQVGWLAHTEHLRPEFDKLALSSIPKFVYGATRDRILPPAIAYEQGRLLKEPVVRINGGHIHPVWKGFETAGPIADRLQSVDPVRALRGDLPSDPLPVQMLEDLAGHTLGLALGMPR